MRTFSFLTILFLIDFPVVLYASGGGLIQSCLYLNLLRERAEWTTAAFTDPMLYVSGQPWRYLFHGVRDRSGTSIPEQIQSETEKKLDTGETIAAVVDVVTNPRNISKRTIFATSIISNEKHNTMTKAGLIIEPSPDNIIAASHRDMMSRHPFTPNLEDKDVAAGLINDAYAEFGLPPPAVILEKSESYGHNEVLFLGESLTGKKVKALGYLIITDEQDRPLITGYLYDQIIAAATKYNLVVRFVRSEKNEYLDPDEGLTFFRNPKSGRRFLTLNENGLRHELEILANRQNGKFYKYENFIGYDCVTARKYFDDFVSKANRSQDSKIKQALIEAGLNW